MAATCPRIFLSGGRRPLLLVPPRMFQSGALGLFPPHFVVVLFRPLLLVLPRMILSWALHVFGCARLLVVLVTSSLHLLRAPPLCCSSASPRPRPLDCSTSSPRPPPLVFIAASPGPCPHLGFSVSPRPRPPLRFAASPRPCPLGRFSCSLWPLLLVPPRMIKSRASTATGPWLFESGGGGSCFLVRPGRLLFAVAPQPLLGLRLCASPLAPVAYWAAWVRFGGRSPPRRVLLGTASRAVVVWLWRAPSGFAAPGGRGCLAPVCVPWLSPAACLSGVPRGPAWCAASRLVRSPSVLWSAFLTPWCLSAPQGRSPPDLLGGCAGHAEAGREPDSLRLPLAPAKAGALGSLRIVPVQGPAMRLSLAGPSGVGLEQFVLRCLACVHLVTHASSFPYCPSFDGGLGRRSGAVSCGRPHLSLGLGGRHARVPCVCACARPFWPGRAGRPPGRALERLTFPFGGFVLLLCLAPSGHGLPLLVGVFAFFPLCFFLPLLFPASAGFLPLLSWALPLFVSSPPLPPPFFLVGLCSSAAPLFRSPTHPLFFVFFSPCLARCLFPLALLFLFPAPLPCLLFSLPPPSLFFVLGVTCFGWCLFSVAFPFDCPPPSFFFASRSLFLLAVPFLYPAPLTFPFVFLCRLASPPRVLFFLFPPPPSLFFCFRRFLLWYVFVSCCLPFLLSSPSFWFLFCLLVFVSVRPSFPLPCPPPPFPLFFYFAPLLCRPPPVPLFPPPPPCFLLFSALPALVGVVFSHRLPFPPPLFFFSFLVFVSSCFFCVAVLPSSVLRVLLWCFASLRCVLPWPFVCAVGCCCVLCHVSGCLVPLLCSRCGPLSCCGLCCRVLCCVPGCCVAPCCCALLRPALCFCALCCVVSLFSVLPRVVSCPQALSVALRSCVVLSPRAVCSVLCVFWRGLLLRAVVCRCVFCCVRPGVSCCAFPVPSTLCGAGLRCAAAVASCCLLGLCYLWRLVLPCVVVCRAFSCGAVLYCCALCRVLLWPAVLCCGLQRGWLAALLCGAGFCAALLSLGALLPCAVLPGPVLLCGAVVSCPAALFVFLCLLVRSLLFKKPPHFVKKNHFFRFRN